jgi:flagellar assembly protein FliH
MTRSPAILKADQARELPARVAFNFDDLRHQAEAHLAAARHEAAAILEAARQEAEALKRQAELQGREEGRAEGLRDAAAQIQSQARQRTSQELELRLKTVLPALTQAAQVLREEREHWLARWESAAIELGVAIAEKLVRTELKTRPELARHMITQALELAVGQSHLRLYLHPADREHLGDQAGQVVHALTGCAVPELVDDPSLQPGDCRIETRHGEIDARLETMLQRIADELLTRE